MDKEMIDFLNKKFTRIDENFEKVDERFAEIRRDIDEKNEESKRHSGVVAESLRGEIRAVAEGHMVLQEQIETFKKENKEEFALVNRKIDALQKEIVEIKKDIAELRLEVEGIKKEVAELRLEVEGMKIDIAGLRKEVEGIKKEIAELRRDNEKSLQEFIAAVKFSYSGLDQRVMVLETKLDSK